MKMVGKVLWSIVKIYLALCAFLWMLIGMGDYLYRCMADDRWTTWRELMEIQYDAIDHAFTGWNLWVSNFKS